MRDLINPVTEDNRKQKVRTVDAELITSTEHNTPVDETKRLDGPHDILDELFHNKRALYFLSTGFALGLIGLIFASVWPLVVGIFILYTGYEFILKKNLR